MKANGFRTFRNVSTFTYLGRNTALYRRAFKHHDPQKEPLRVMIVGSGPFEPFYVSRLGRHKIHAVDIGKNMCEMIAGLKNGAFVELAHAAERCCNVNDDGKPRPNRDLSAPERIEQAMREMEMSGFNPDDFLSGRNTYFRLREKNPDVTPVNRDIFEHLEEPNAYDVVAMCTLFINLRKTLGDDDIAKLFVSLSQVMASADRRDSGILAIGETPAAVHGPKNVVGFMVGAGFIITDMLVDNLVNARGSLRGGYGIIARRDGHFARKRSGLDARKLEQEFQEGPFGGSDVSAVLVHEDALVSFLETTDRVVLAALRTKLHEMTVYTADKQKLIAGLSETRTSFGLSRFDSEIR